MTNTRFTQEEIDFFVGHKEFWQGLWKPREGDWYVWKYGVQLTPRCLNYRDAREMRHAMEWDKTARDKYTPLFTEGQLIKMLKGAGWSLEGLYERLDESWCVEICPNPRAYRWAEGKSFEGPTPIIALMRAVREVAKK